MNPLSESQLIRLVKQGDERATADFVDRFGGRVHALSRRYARTEADAEDLTQEIFVDLFRGIAGFRGDAALYTWVYRVALNHCLKHRDRRREDSLPLDDSRVPAAGDQFDPVRQATKAELARTVETALSELTPEHREVVVLHELHGLTYVECAALLEIPVGTVKSRLSNAFKRLRTRLRGYLLDSEAEVGLGTEGMTLRRAEAGGEVR
ncbi:MAG TPA: sigma-70 family RNA polymerase sigma factor [Armatimonadaceae bacterium]|nr:sigma-70 family RNA polymerase sigma factor [Armatimonadaceae bacterium]